jgi:ribokinase
LAAEDVDAAAELIAGASVVLVQLEVPAETVARAIAVARRAGAKVILDPAPVPADGLAGGLYEVDVLTPNQSEAETLVASKRTMGRMRRTKAVDVRQLGEELLERGPEAVVLKLGRKGALLVNGEEIEHVKGKKVTVIDTTAAGDAFNGALAVAMAEGMELGRAVRFANAAGAKACETFGAQPALPTRMEVEGLMEGMH